MFMAVSEKQLQHAKNYQAKLDDIKIRVPKGTKDIWKAEAEKRDKSLNQFVIDCVEKEINSEN